MQSSSSSRHFLQKHMQLAPWLSLLAPPHEWPWRLALSVPRVLLGALHHQRHGQVVLMPDGFLAMMQCATPGPAQWWKVTCTRSYQRTAFPAYRQWRLLFASTFSPARCRQEENILKCRRKKHQLVFMLVKCVTRHKRYLNARPFTSIW